MKRIYFLVALLIPVLAHGQQNVIVQGDTNDLIKDKSNYEFQGSVKLAKGDTSAGNISILPSGLFYNDGTAWKLAGSGNSDTVANIKDWDSTQAYKKNAVVMYRDNHSDINYPGAITKSSNYLYRSVSDSNINILPTTYIKNEWTKLTYIIDTGHQQIPINYPIAPNDIKLWDSTINYSKGDVAIIQQPIPPGDTLNLLIISHRDNNLNNNPVGTVEGQFAWGVLTDPQINIFNYMGVWNDTTTYLPYNLGTPVTYCSYKDGYLWIGSRGDTASSTKGVFRDKSKGWERIGDDVYRVFSGNTSIGGSLLLSSKKVVDTLGNEAILPNSSGTLALTNQLFSGNYNDLTNKPNTFYNDNGTVSSPRTISFPNNLTFDGTNNANFRINTSTFLINTPFGSYFRMDSIGYYLAGGAMFYLNNRVPLYGNNFNTIFGDNSGRIGIQANQGVSINTTNGSNGSKPTGRLFYLSTDQRISDNGWLALSTDKLTGSTSANPDTLYFPDNSNQGTILTTKDTNSFLATKSDIPPGVIYTDGNGIKLTGNQFSVTRTTSGTGTFVTGVNPTTDGYEVTFGTPPSSAPQTLSLVGQSLSISGGNSVTLPTQDLSGYEVKSNKATNFSSPNDATYPTTEAVYNNFVNTGSYASLDWLALPNTYQEGWTPTLSNSPASQTRGFVKQIGGSNNNFKQFMPDVGSPDAWYYNYKRNGAEQTVYQVASRQWVQGLGFITANQNIALTGDVTGSGTTSILTTIGANKVTLDKIQSIPTQTLMGRYSTGTGNVQSITLGANINLSGGGVLSSTTDLFSSSSNQTMDTLYSREFATYVADSSFTAGGDIPILRFGIMSNYSIGHPNNKFPNLDGLTGRLFWSNANGQLTYEQGAYNPTVFNIRGEVKGWPATQDSNFVTLNQLNSKVISGATTITSGGSTFVLVSGLPAGAVGFSISALDSDGANFLKNSGYYFHQETNGDVTVTFLIAPADSIEISYIITY